MSGYVTEKDKKRAAEGPFFAVCYQTVVVCFFRMRMSSTHGSPLPSYPFQTLDGPILRLDKLWKTSKEYIYLIKGFISLSTQMLPRRI